MKINSYSDAKQLLEEHAQQHVLKFWEKLSSNEQADLLKQIETVDFANIATMQAMLEDKSDNDAVFEPNTEPAPVLTPSRQEITEATVTGEEALKNGRVGVIVVAGGQGSRLGFDGPKGAYPVAPISNATLFEIHSHKILRLEEKYDTQVPFYIMTSETNDKPTRDFFRENHYFGLDPERVLFFTQGMWPTLSAEGKIILDAPHHIFMSPDGHGGTLSALKNSGMLDDMASRGLNALFYFQIDNPLVEIPDPAFVGLHTDKGADISVKVCAKRDASEGLGVVAVCNGTNKVIEYIDLPDDAASATMPDGSLKFLYGSVAIHMFSLDFLRQEANAGLPLHVAHKKVPCCDEHGNTIKPDQPNAFKFEKFIFDVLPDAQTVLNLEFAREEEFSPVKNATGSDSPETTRRDMMRKFSRWLEECGVDVPTDNSGTPTCKIEIDPCFAGNAKELKAKLPEDFTITGDVLLA